MCFFFHLLLFFFFFSFLFPSSETHHPQDVAEEAVMDAAMEMGLAWAVSGVPGGEGCQS